MVEIHYTEDGQVCLIENGHILTPYEAQPILIDLQSFYDRATRRTMDRLNGTQTPVSGDTSYNSGYVYVVRGAGNLYKIGLTRSFEQRQKTLRSKFGPIELIHLITCDNAYRAESALHVHFSSKQVANEWFALADDDIAWIRTHETDGELWR